MPRNIQQRLLAGQPLDEAVQVPECLQPGTVATLLAAPALIEATWPDFSARGRGAQPIPLSFGDFMAPEEPPKRFLLADLYESCNPTQPIRTLLPASDLSVAVSIAPPRDGAIVASDLFPDQECAGQLLTVLFAEPRLAPEPQLRTLYLPPAGPSAEVRFALRLTPETTAIEARISVLYRNRILQTALLRGPVGERPRLDVEMSVRPGMRNLAEQCPADYALLLNHTGDGESRANRRRRLCLCLVFHAASGSVHRCHRSQGQRHRLGRRRLRKPGIGGHRRTPALPGSPRLGALQRVSALRTRRPAPAQRLLRAGRLARARRPPAHRVLLRPQDA